MGWMRGSTARVYHRGFVSSLTRLRPQQPLASLVSMIDGEKVGFAPKFCSQLYALAPERERQNEETHDQCPYYWRPFTNAARSGRREPWAAILTAPQQQNQYPERNLPPAAVRQPGSHF